MLILRKLHLPFERLKAGQRPQRVESWIGPQVDQRRVVLRVRPFELVERGPRLAERGVDQRDVVLRRLSQRQILLERAPRLLFLAGHRVGGGEHVLERCAVGACRDRL